VAPLSKANVLAKVDTVLLTQAYPPLLSSSVAVHNYSGVKIYNHLPTHIKSLSKDPKHFKIKLKSFLLEQSLYSLEEFYQVPSKEFYPMYDM
jgi:hypothetical protein